MNSRADYVLKLGLYKILQGIRCLNSSKIHIFKVNDLISTYLVFWNCPSKLILMKFLCLRTFIFWPYVVPRPKFGLAAPLIYRGHNKNLMFFGPFGSNPAWKNPRSWISSLWRIPEPLEVNEWEKPIEECNYWSVCSKYPPCLQNRCGIFLFAFVPGFNFL